MKATCYLRVAETNRGFVYGATAKPSPAPLTSGSYNTPVPTRQFRLVLNLPDNAFDAIDGQVEIDVPSQVLTEVVHATAEEIA